MANGKIRFGKQSGGELALVIPDGVDNTEVIVPESGVLATEQYADGKTTLVQVQAEISTGSNLVTSPTGAIGYGTGAGGTVTQLATKTSPIVIHKPTGTITMHNQVLAAGTTAVFNFTNSMINTFDLIKFQIISGYSSYDSYKIESDVVNGNVVRVKLTNISSSSLSEAVILSFNIIKGANS